MEGQVAEERQVRRCAADRGGRDIDRLGDREGRRRELVGLKALVAQSVVAPALVGPDRGRVDGQGPGREVRRVPGRFDGDRSAHAVGPPHRIGLGRQVRELLAHAVAGHASRTDRPLARDIAIGGRILRRLIRRRSERRLGVRRRVARRRCVRQREGCDRVAAQDLVVGDEATHDDGRDGQHGEGDRASSGHEEAPPEGGAVWCRRPSDSQRTLRAR